MPFYTPLVISTSTLMLALSVMGPHTPTIICAVAGLFGGCIAQLLTVDERKPPRKVLIGNLLISGVLGFAVYVGAGELNNAVILGAIAAGTTGWAGWSKVVRVYLPKWLHEGDNEQPK